MKLVFVYLLMYFYFQMTRRFSADEQVKHLCLVSSFTVLHVLSGLNGESKAVSTESLSGWRTVLPVQHAWVEGTLQAVGGSPGDRQSTGLESRRNDLALRL